MKVGQRQVGQPHAAIERRADQFADDAVSSPLRSAARDQVFHQGGGVQVATVEPLGNARAVQFSAGYQWGRQLQASQHGVEGVEQPLFVFLQVAIVGQWQPFDQDQERGQVADHAGRFAAHQFQHIGIDLLWHDRRAGAERLG